MRSVGNSFKYFPENHLTRLAHFVQFRRVLMFCLRVWETPPLSTLLA